MTAPEPPQRPYQPGLPWRLTSAATIGAVGFLSRSFLYGLNKTRTTGLDRFLQILDERKDETKRTKGLVTVSNHVSVLDDPMIWGVLPNRYFWQPNNMRWSLGSYDICFKNAFTRGFFSYGNTLPTHRSAYSQYGGLFQPTMTHAIRLLSDPHAHTAPENWEGSTRPASSNALSSTSDKDSFPTSDPFSSAELNYTTTGKDSFPSPDVYPSRRHSWVHIFPEGMIHQHPDKVMRYFKWGVARLILEAEPCPDVMPMWIDGPQHVMDDKRPWPRPLPRLGRDISINFGELVDTDKVFEPFRARWRDLKRRAQEKRKEYLSDLASSSSSSSYSALSSLSGDTLAEEDARVRKQKDELGIVTDWELKFGKEAEQLRIDVTLAVRNEVLKVRRASGLPDEDPKRSLADTFREEGLRLRERLKKDGSYVRAE